MYVTYFDEVKPDLRSGQRRYFVGGLVVPMEHIGPVEDKVTALAQELFKSRELVSETEFHGTDIYRAKGPFRGRSMADRAGIFGKLADIIVDGGHIKKVYASIDTIKLYKPESAAEFAFAHFVERVQMCIGVKPSILIGDLDDEQARNMVRDFSKFTARGTPWAYGIDIRPAGFAFASHQSLSLCTMTGERRRT